MSAPRSFWRAVAGSAVVLWAAAGCLTVREIEKPAADTTLMVIRTEQVVTLQWQAEAGVDYVVWYADQRGARAMWKTLPGAERVVGQGDRVTLRDQVPSGVNRYYRLQAAPRANP